MTSKTRIRVSIIDESVLCRHSLDTALANTPDIEVLGASPNGKTGLARILHDKPDVVILSASLRDLDPCTVVARALEALPALGIVLTIDEDNPATEVVERALDAGATDFVRKPGKSCGNDLVETLGRRLLPKVRNSSTVALSRFARNAARRGPGHAGGPAIATNGLTPEAIARGQLRRAASRSLVVIGASTGGPDALTRLLPRLPADFPAPVVVAVHMPGLFTTSLARTLNGRCALAVVEASDGLKAEPGTIYLAPGERHLIVEPGEDGTLTLRTVDEPPVDGCRPSVDLLFRSAAKLPPSTVVAVVLTGMGSDGTEGSAALKAVRAYVFAQDEASSVVWGMPGATVRAGLADEVLDLDRIAVRLAEKVTR